MAASLHGGPAYDGEDSFGGYRPMAEINVTPFVDVMLVLLIIFMVAAPLMMVGVPLDLPKTDAAKIEKTREPLVVSLDKDGRIFIGKDEIAEEMLIPRLAELREADTDAPIYVRSDRGIEYGDVMNLLGKVGKAGFAKVSLIAEADQGAASGAQPRTGARQEAPVSLPSGAVRRGP